MEEFQQTAGEIVKGIEPILFGVLGCRPLAMLKEGLDRIPVKTREEHKTFFDCYQAYYSTMEAFVAAVNIAALRYERRYTAPGWAVLFISGAFIVEERTKELTVLDEKKPFKSVPYWWIENSGISFGQTVGFCALDVATRFSLMTYDYIKEGREESRSGRKDLNSLVVVPEPETCVARWMKITVLKMQEKLPPISDWPEWRMNAEKESIAMKMLAELTNIERVYHDAGHKDDEYERRVVDKKREPMIALFSFSPGQVKYSNRDLELPTGFTIEVFGKLSSHFNTVVKYEDLDPLNSCAGLASEQLRKAIYIINRNFKESKVPYRVESKTRVGYQLTSADKSSHN